MNSQRADVMKQIRDRDVQRRLDPGPTRRWMMKAVATTPAALAVSGLPGCGATRSATTISDTRAGKTVSLDPTPTCHDFQTPSQTEGPYFTPNSPERASLLDAGAKGTPLLLEGSVVSRLCRPIAKALLDVWHCDDAGIYDNTGSRFRGHQFSASDGTYKFATIIPGVYPGRTRHIHIKVQSPGKPVLTTQLYFPNEPGNSKDSIFLDKLLISVVDDPRGKIARFIFVLDA